MESSRQHAVDDTLRPVPSGLGFEFPASSQDPSSYGRSSAEEEKMGPPEADS
jgi:hypothetical protein